MNNTITEVSQFHPRMLSSSQEMKKRASEKLDILGNLLIRPVKLLELGTFIDFMMRKISKVYLDVISSQFRAEKPKYQNDYDNMLEF